MKHVFGISLSSFLALTCLLSATLVASGPAMAKPGGEKEQATVVYAEPIARDPVVTAKIEALRAAKQAGDVERVRSLCAELGWISAEDPDRASKAAADASYDVYRSELAIRNDKPGSDVQVNNPSWTSSNPAMAGTADGVLYVVVDDVGYGRNYLDIYYSDNDGYTWIYYMSIASAYDLTNPSIAIGEGNVNRLLIAYEVGRGTANAAIHVYWRDLDTSASGQVVVDNNPYWLDNPQICVDSPEYNNWWPYLTYTRGLITKQDRYDLVFTRSFDYGETWQTPGVLATDVALDCKPDIDYGAASLYLTYTKYEAPYEDDVYLLRSLDLGNSWGSELLLVHGFQDETNPRVAATNGGGTVVVAFTHEYSATDTDIEAYVSQDSGDSWSLAYLPYTDYAETTVDLAVSPELGRIHAAFWSEHDIHYTWASWDTPNIWAPVEVMNDGGTAAIWIRPTVAVNPTKQQEACVAWTDTRVELQYHVFFDAAYPVTTGVPDASQTPHHEFKMEQNYPNPFNPSTTIAYELPQASPVKLGIYDVSGRLVRSLVNGTSEIAGPHQVTWDGRDHTGRIAPAGVYIYRLEAGILRDTQRMVLVK